MIAVGINYVSIIFGWLQILGAVVYFAMFAIKLRRSTDIALRIFQLIFAPLILFLIGGILIIFGWRLDPTMQFREVLVNVLIIYLILLNVKRSKHEISRE
ncbi:Ycf66 family protein [Pantanalinema sp. GBBB05]|uniref:Ycf66 family protein n=1 Tax=Pantanalinema sp. GBBB05 TaxID=2604139 RepID=UPI001D6992D0|nr:hypothetical protein [Pantanalinema sp. GBBB05]